MGTTASAQKRSTSDVQAQGAQIPCIEVVDEEKSPRILVKSTSLGLSLPYIEEFVNRCGGNANFVGLSILDVNNTFLVPFRDEYKVSLCSLLREQKHEHVGVSSVYICCSWNCQFLELIESLQHYFGHSSTVYIWVEIFTDFTRSDMSYPACRDIFLESLKFYDKITLIRIPYNPYNHISKEWILNEISVIVSQFNIFSHSLLYHFI
jgi:hypothetical protein